MLGLSARTLLTVGGTVLGIAGTIVSGIAGQKALKEEVAKEVAKALNK